MYEAREGVAVFGKQGECRYASEGFEWWAGRPVSVQEGEPLERAFSRSGIRALPGVRGGFEGPRGSFYAAVEHLEGIAVVRVSPLEGRDPRALHGRFLSVASHDLRGALANVRSYASLIKTPRFGLPEKALKAVDVIARNADKALALSEDIFDALKAEAGTLRIEKSPEPLRPMLERALESCQATAADKGASIALEPGAGLDQVFVDPDRFTRACAALLAHAVWRTPEGGQVGLVAAARDDQVEISAWDEGALATPEELASAFDRDSRVARERTLAGGFRLCLASALARALDGDVGARLDRHGRQNFFFTVPAQASEQLSAPG